jgi:hypothetical protein
MTVPMVMPHLFRHLFEWTGALYDGEEQLDRETLLDIGASLTAFYGEDPGLYETVLVTVATEFFNDEAARACYLARADALSLLFADARLMEAWAGHGWVRRSAIDPDRFAPARFVVEAAAICPLGKYGPAFGLLDFHAAAYCRAAALGVEFC